MELEKLKKIVAKNGDEGVAFDKLMGLVKIGNQVGERESKIITAAAENNLGELVEGCIDNNGNDILQWYSANLDRMKYANDSLNASNLLQTNKDIMTILQYGQALYWDKIFIKIAAKIDSALSQINGGLYGNI